MMLARQTTRATSASVLPVAFASRGAVAGSLRLLAARNAPLMGQRAMASLPADAEGTAASKPNRPLSPHVTIYKFPLPALTSITNRVTGAALTAGIYSAGAFALFGAHDLPVYLDAFKTAAPLLVVPTKFLISFPVVYHTLAGVRHLYWDYTTKGLSLPAVYNSSYALIGMTALFTLGLTFYSR